MRFVLVVSLTLSLWNGAVAAGTLRPPNSFAINDPGDVMLADRPAARRGAAPGGKFATVRASRSAQKTSTVTTPSPAHSQSTPQERLFQRIISNEQLTRPDLTDVPINVTVRVILIKLQDLIEKSELMETTVRIQIGWRDKRLAWDKNEFGQLTEILLPSSSVWIPDLAVINSVSDVYSVVRDTRFEIKVENDGQLWWHPTGVLKTFCKLRLSYFPFDRQKCSIIVESPTFDRRFLKLKLRSERTPVDLRMYVDSETWRLEKTFGTSQDLKVGLNTYFSRIEFWLVIERARLYHTINFILPCFILSAIQTVFFFLPATHPQRVGSTTVTMLSVMVFQSMVVAQLPKTSESVPLLSIYIDIIIVVSATSVCTSIFTALCHFNHDRHVKVPLWLRNCCAWRIVARQRRRQQREAAAEALLTGNPSLINDSNTRRKLSAFNEQPHARLAVPQGNDTAIAIPSCTSEDMPTGIEIVVTPRTVTSDDVTWLDVLQCINYILGCLCALAISLGPAVIFGLIPSVVDHQDYPVPIGGGRGNVSVYQGVMEFPSQS